LRLTFARSGEGEPLLTLVLVAPADDDRNGMSITTPLLRGDGEPVPPAMLPPEARIAGEGDDCGDSPATEGATPASSSNASALALRRGPCCCCWWPPPVGVWRGDRAVMGPPAMGPAITRCALVVMLLLWPPGEEDPSISEGDAMPGERGDAPTAVPA
jgi:hypothetical protein